MMTVTIIHLHKIDLNTVYVFNIKLIYFTLGGKTMFKKISFGTTDAQEKLASLKGKYVLTEGMSVEEANDTLEKVIFALNIYEKAPKYVLTRAMYPETGAFEEARFVVRPASKAALEVSEMKRVFAIQAGVDFFDRFIKEMAIWFDEYDYYYKLNANVTELNEKVEALATEAEIPFSVKFGVGTGIIDVSNDSIVIGLTVDTVLNLEKLPLFDEAFADRANLYGEKVVEAMKACTTPWDMLKTRNTFTKDIDIVSRKSIVKLMRKVVNRNLKFVRVGTGYVDADNYFTIVEKTAVTPEEAEANYADAIIVDNTNISKVEAKAGQTKIAIKFVVSPIKADGELVDVSLEDVLAEVE